MIKQAIYVAIMAAVLSVPRAQQNTTTEYIVGLPSTIEESTRKVLAKSVIDLVFGGSAGDRYVFVDAQNLQRIKAFDRADVRSKRALLKRMRGELGALGNYLKDAVKEGADAEQRNAIRFPQFLSMASSLRDPAKKTRVVAFGSAFYRQDTSFAMGGGLYPSDAHLNAPLSTSVYSCEGKGASLRAAGVYLCYLSESFESSFERNAVRRWWQIYCAGHGAVLGQISASAPDVVEAAVRGDMRPAVVATVDVKDTRVEMRRAGAEVPVQPRSKLATAADAIPAPTKGKFTVAAFWPEASGSRVDVDIHLQARPGADEISFRQKETRDGTLLRDVTGGGEGSPSGEWRAAWEVVEVNETAFREAKAWLNLFSYQGPGPIEGIVRVALGTRHVDLPFAFAKGVEGGASKLGQRERRDSSQWVEIDLAAAFERLKGQR